MTWHSRAGRAVLIVAVFLVAVVAQPAWPARAEATVVGAGQIDVSATSEGLLVTFACEGAAIGAVVATKIAAETGCTVQRNGVVLASAPGRTLPGPVVATGDAREVATGLGALQVCWAIEGIGVDDTTAFARGCKTAGA